MTLVPELQIGLWTGWWFSAVFGLVNLILVAAYPKGFYKRLFRFPQFTSLKERIVSMSSVFLFGRGLIIYSVFVPLRPNTVWFLIGTTVFVLGLVVHTMAMINFAATPHDQPVIKGVYRFSRHPMQVIAIVMWLGVGIATVSWLIILVCCIQVFLSHRFLIAQERFCLEKYGEKYRKYMEKTPRYFPVLKRESD